MIEGAKPGRGVRALAGFSPRCGSDGAGLADSIARPVTERSGVHICQQIASRSGIIGNQFRPSHNEAGKPMKNVYPSVYLKQLSNARDNVSASLYAFYY